MTIKYKKQLGAVSLYVVIFSTILISIITVSFITVMIRNQRQAIDNDLAQSAYDSALAGVEDGKRSALRYFNCLENSTDGCVDVINAMTSPTQGCTDVVSGLEGVNVENGEVKVDSGSSTDKNFQQAYTCVKVSIDTPDYLGVLAKNESKLVPLVGKSTFNSIRLDWYMKSDLASGSLIDLTPGRPKLLYDSGKWGGNPSIMRSNYFYYDSGSIDLSNFDFNYDNNNINTRSKSIFLYPVGDTDPISIGPIGISSADIRKPSISKFVNPTYCKSDFTVSGGYACTKTIILPEEIDSGKQAFVYLSSLYAKSNYKITLLNGLVSVDFAGVQPEIDSTGRSNDLFRRIKNRVEIVNPNFPYPASAIDIDGNGNLCKAFQVTKDSADYDSSECTP